MIKKSRGGRPTKFTEKIINDILKYIETGSTYRDACLLSGISETTFQDWNKKGKSAILNGVVDKFSGFSARIQQSEAKYRAYLLQCVNTQIPTDGNLALKVLERLDSERFGKKNKLDVTMEIEELDNKKSVYDMTDKEIENEIIDLLGKRNGKKKVKKIEHKKKGKQNER
jgi:hypothetical protein